MAVCNYCNETMAFPYACSLCKIKHCGSHRLPEMHSCVNLYAFNSDEFRHLKTQQSTDNSVKFLEDIDKEVQREEIEEMIHDDPDVISFGKERLDLLVGLGLIVFASTFFQLVVGWYSFIHVLILAFLVGPAFILHELAHKYMSIYFGKAARFLLRRRMAIGTLVMGLIPFGIIGPGVATTFERTSERESGIISFAGPFVNLILSFLYFLIYSILENNLNPYAVIFALGVRLNIFLGMFNLIPFGPLDGLKIYNWSPTAWILVALSFAIQYFFVGMVIR